MTAVFVSFALLLMTRKERLFGPEVDLFGWSYYLDKLLAAAGSSPVGFMIDDGSVSVAVALTLFMIPAAKENGGRLMDWEDAKRVPWGILLLFGGGLAIAKVLEPLACQITLLHSSRPSSVMQSSSLS